MGKQARIQEIEGWLAAYRAGWIAYDRQHVQRLQAERAALNKAQQVTA